jgi:hypothetical protein
MNEPFSVLFVDSNPVYCNTALVALNSIGIIVDTNVSFHSARKHIAKNGSQATACFIGIDPDLNTTLKRKIDVVRLCIAMHIPYLTTFQRDDRSVKLSSFSREWKDTGKMFEDLIEFNITGKKSDVLFWYKVWDYVVVGHGARHNDSRCSIVGPNIQPENWTAVIEEKRKEAWSPFNIELMRSWQIWRKAYKKSLGTEIYCEKDRLIA